MSECQVSECRVSECQVSEYQVSECQVSESEWYGGGEEDSEGVGKTVQVG